MACSRGTPYTANIRRNWRYELKLDIVGKEVEVGGVIHEVLPIRSGSVVLWQ